MGGGLRRVVERRRGCRTENEGRSLMVLRTGNKWGVDSERSSGRGSVGQKKRGEVGWYGGRATKRGGKIRRGVVEGEAV